MRSILNNVFGRSKRRRSILRKNARGRGPRGRRLLCEALEERTLLSGVTLLTHGFQLFTVYPGWVESMADEVTDRIAQKYGATSNDVARYHIEIGDLDVVPPAVQNTINPEAGSATFDTASTGEVVVTVDWSDVSQGAFRTQSVAEGIAKTLLSTYAGIGISAPLAALPIQLIGHSRGASVMGALAEDLGELGIWVEQSTYLDAHPLAVPEDWGDDGMAATANIVFADSYWRSDDINVLEPLDWDGERVDGAHDVPLTEDILDDWGGYYNEHSDTHLWYQGTIDIESDIISDGSASVAASAWYNGNMGPRDQIGYNYSRVVGGDRPADGLHPDLGGTESRQAIDWTNANWPNILEFHSESSIVEIGDPLEVSYYWHDRDGSAWLALYLDADRNPYNGTGQQIGQNKVLPRTFPKLLDNESHTVSTTGVNAGQYNLLAKIFDLTRTRYVYAPGSIELRDTTPPTPNPSTWSTEPYATGTTSIKMYATSSSDPSGVQYYFDCTTSGCHDSGWQDSRVYEDTGLSPNTSYTYRVRTRDKSSNQNTGGHSSSRAATTDPPPVPEMEVRGNDQGISDGDETPSLSDHTDFGSLVVTAGITTRRFAIINTGSAALNLTGSPQRVVISGSHASDFTVTQQPTSPVTSNGGITTFEVSFDPTLNSRREATIIIANDDSNEAPYDFKIQGTGIGQVFSKECPHGGNVFQHSENDGGDQGQCSRVRGRQRYGRRDR